MPVPNTQNLLNCCNTVIAITPAGFYPNMSTIDPIRKSELEMTTSWREHANNTINNSQHNRSIDNMSFEKTARVQQLDNIEPQISTFGISRMSLPYPTLKKP